MLFGIFILNVTLGAMRAGVFLTDIQELLVLFASVLAFVVAVLAIEKAAIGRERRASADAPGARGDSGEERP